MLRTALQLLPFMRWFSVTALGAERSSRPTGHLLFVLGPTAVIFVIVVLFLAMARLIRAAPLRPAICSNGGPPTARIMKPTQLFNIFAPESTPTRAIVDLSTLVLSITAVIFVVVASLLVYAVVKFRAVPASADREPA
jgi:heme/copper-type cytochrome/quinol oxidase subunit 2